MKNYLEIVETEIKLLKINATEEELENLDFYCLNPVSQNNCIYGQMTGYCENNRAVELINLCCKTELKFPLVGSPIPKKLERIKQSFGAYSYLENFIFRFPSCNEHIIDYLQGKVDVLEISC